MSMRNAFLVLTTKHADAVLGLFQDIRDAAAQLGDAYIVYHKTTDALPEGIRQQPHFLFTNDILHDMGYTPITDKLVPGSNHFPLLDFYRKHPDYAYYWYIEDDVRFTGPWRALFEGVHQAPEQPDLLSCHLRTFQQEPAWCWWDSITHPDCYIPFNLLIRSFNPIMRISNSALQCIDRALLDNWRGHHEVLLPTLLCYEGYQVADFGGNGIFVTPGREEQWYITGDYNAEGILHLGSMRFRPVIANEELVGQKLYHPVKE